MKILWDLFKNTYKQNIHQLVLVVLEENILCEEIAVIQYLEVLHGARVVLNHLGQRNWHHFLQLVLDGAAHS